MTEPKPQSGSNAGIVILIVCLLLGLPCLAGVVAVGGALFFIGVKSSPPTQVATTSRPLRRPFAAAPIVLAPKRRHGSP